MYLKIGDLAPKFSLENQNGNIVKLEDFKGKTIVLWFFPKANTPGWTMQGIGFRDEFKNFEDRNIEIVGVSADTSDRQKKFQNKL